MGRALRNTIRIVLVIALAVATLWGALAIWYRLPGPDVVRLVVAALFALIGLAVCAGQFGKRPIRALGAFAALFAGLLAWWSTIAPPATGNWSPEVARQTTGQIDGDILSLRDIRDFTWHSASTSDAKWQDETYDLSQVQTVDMFMSYWAGPEMAHFILSFGFSDGRYLAWSIEVRREIDGGFSPVADAFKTNTLAILATTEQDVVGLRTNYRKEDVQLFRLRTPPEAARALLEEYVRDANQLAAAPQWYNSLTTNCTTVVFKMLRAIGARQTFDWRMIVNGYLPDYAYERGALARSFPLADLRAKGSISARAQAAGVGPDFSDVIRAGVPVPAP